MWLYILLENRWTFTFINFLFDQNVTTRPIRLYRVTEVDAASKLFKMSRLVQAYVRIGHSIFQKANKNASFPLDVPSIREKRVLNFFELNKLFFLFLFLCIIYDHFSFSLSLSLNFINRVNLVFIIDNYNFFFNKDKRKDISKLYNYTVMYN